MSRTFVGQDPDVAASVDAEVRYGVQKFVRSRRLDIVSEAIGAINGKVGLGLVLSDGSMIGVILEPAEVQGMVDQLRKAEIDAETTGGLRAGIDYVVDERKVDG